jgi:hypothetical protein
MRKRTWHKTERRQSVQIVQLCIEVETNSSIQPDEVGTNSPVQLKVKTNSPVRPHKVETILPVQQIESN